MVNVKKILEYVERNNLGRCARHLPTGQPRGLLEPMTREEYSREIGYSDALNRHFKTGVEDLM